MTREERKRVVTRLLLVGVLFVGFLIAGTVAFATVGNEGGEEAFYRTLGSITTASIVAEPDTSAERAISATLAIAGGLFYLLLIGSVVGALARRLLSEEVGGRRRKRRMMDIINSGNHYIVCGYGQVGRATVEALRQADMSVVVIDKKLENLAMAERQPHVAAIQGEASSQETLLEAGIMRAAGLVACVGTDAENLYITLTAHRLHPSISLAARASDEENARRLVLQVEGLHVTTPYKSAGVELAELVCSVDSKAH